MTFVFLGGIVFLTEIDSSLVVLAFKYASLIPWSLTNRWNNCNLLLASMNYLVTHIYREGKNFTFSNKSEIRRSVHFIL